MVGEIEGFSLGSIVGAPEGRVVGVDVGAPVAVVVVLLLVTGRVVNGSGVLLAALGATVG